MSTRTARYHGTCGDCGRHFAAGTLIEWRPGYSSPVDCSCKSAAAPAPVAVQVQAPVVAMVVAPAPAPEASAPIAPTVRKNQSAGWCEACVTALKPGEGRVVACNGCERHWGVEGWLHVFCADGEACAARLAARTARFERQRAARKARETRVVVRTADVDPAARRIARARLVAELGPLAARLALGGEHMTLAPKATTARLPWHVTPPRLEVPRRPFPRAAIDAAPKLRRCASPTRSPRTRGWSASGAWPSGHPPSKST